MKSETDFINRLLNEKKKDKAFKELLDLYQKRLYWHIRKLVITHENANDVLQNTFMKVFKHIDGFKGESKLFSWMYRIATNEALSFLNKKAKHAGTDIQSFGEQRVENLEADTYFDGDEIQLQLQRAIAKLSQKQQLVFNMRYFDALKYEDMSEILETSVGALKASYHHARKKIELYFKNEL